MAPRSKKIRAPSEIFFGYRKSRECSQKSLIFANGIPAQKVSCAVRGPRLI